MRTHQRGNSLQSTHRGVARPDRKRRVGEFLVGAGEHGPGICVEVDEGHKIGHPQRGGSDADHADVRVRADPSDEDDIGAEAGAEQKRGGEEHREVLLLEVLSQAVRPVGETCDVPISINDDVGVGGGGGGVKGSLRGEDSMSASLRPRQGNQNNSYCQRNLSSIGVTTTNARWFIWRQLLRATANRNEQSFVSYHHSSRKKKNAHIFILLARVFQPYVRTTSTSNTE